MMGGPTVRRMHRQREERRQQRLRARRAAVPAEVYWGQVFVEECVDEYLPEYEYIDRCPLGMADVLALAAGRDALVLAGQVWHIYWSATPGAIKISIAGQEGWMRMVGTLQQQLNMVLADKYGALAKWRRYKEGRTAPDWSWFRSYSEVDERVAEFVEQRLIPHLRSQRAGASQKQPRRAVEETTWRDGVGDGAFVGGNWYELVPFWGMPLPGQFHLHSEAGVWVGLRQEERATALARYDIALEREVTRIMAAAKEEFIYEDATYRVQGASGRGHYLYQRLSAFAIEAEDRRLYYFDPVDIRIPILAVDPRYVLREHVVEATPGYRHMFTQRYEYRHIVCMPRSEDYYRMLYRQPLQEALLQHLESARMTLCAGYTSLSAPGHPIRACGRQTIGEEEARERSVPIYRYYRQ